MFIVAANTRQAIVGQKEWITTGSSGIQVQFLFSDDWEGLSKFAVFRNAEIEESKIPIALTESNLTELPAENCAAEYVDEKVYVGVYGSDGLGHIIIPTIWVSLGVLKEGADYEGMDPPQPTPDMWAQILAIAQNAGAENAEAAEKAADEAKTAVTHYPKIVDRYWYVWNAETETWVNTGIRAEGRDGYSPEVTITEIEGGHRVTITDEDHPQGQTFDVMDGQGGGTGDYDELTNRPRINGHTLTGNQSAADLGLGTYNKPADGIPKTELAQDVQQSLRKADTALQTAPVQSVAGKTGAVNLGAGDVGFNSSEEYNEGTVGAELSELNRHLSDLDGVVTDQTTGLDTKAPVILETASGAIASFSDGANGMPIKKLVAQIEPVQDLHGYDYPWPAGGGKNLLPDLKFQRGTQYVYLGQDVGQSDFQIHLVAGTYTLSVDNTVSASLYYKETQDESATKITSAGTDRVGTFTLASDGDYQFWLYTVDGITTSDITKFQLEAGSAATTYASYENICPISGWTEADIYQEAEYDADADPSITVNWEDEAGTVYGGTLDVITGELTADMAIKTETWGNFIGEAAIGSLIRRQVSISDNQGDYKNREKTISNIAPFVSQINDESIHVSMASSGSYLYAILPTTVSQDQVITIAYPLATPQTYQLTAEQVSGILTTLYGTNNIWSSTGDTEVTYPADTKIFIEKLTQPTEDDMTANANIAANTFFMIGNTLYFSTAAIAQGATIIPGTNCNLVSLADALNQLNT